VKTQEKDFRHCGIDYNQSEDFKTISHSQVKFADAMQYHHTDKVRSKMSESPLTSVEDTAYKSILGGIQWLERTRGDMSAEKSSLQTRRNCATVKDLKEANSLLRNVKDTASESILMYRALTKGKWRLVVIADASFNSLGKVKTEDEKKTQAGWIILLMPDDESLDTSNCHVLTWCSRRAKRVTKSTLAGEAVSRVAAVEDAIRIAGWLTELYEPELSTKDLLIRQESGKFTFPIDVVTDARSLHEVMISPSEPKPSDPGSLLWLRWLREAHTYGQIRNAIWVSTGDMLADGLTKVMDGSAIRNLFRTGIIKLEYSILVGAGVVDGWKGKPPTKKEKDEQGYHLIDSILRSYFLY